MEEWDVRTAGSREPLWRQPRGKLMVSLVNSHSNASIIGWHLWEIDLRFASGLPAGWHGVISRREGSARVRFPWGQQRTQARHRREGGRGWNGGGGALPSPH